MGTGSCMGTGICNWYIKSEKYISSSFGVTTVTVPGFNFSLSVSHNNHDCKLNLFKLLKNYPMLCKENQMRRRCCFNSFCTYKLIKNPLSSNIFIRQKLTNLISWGQWFELSVTFVELMFNLLVHISLISFKQMILFRNYWSLVTWFITKTLSYNFFSSCCNDVIGNLMNVVTDVEKFASFGTHSIHKIKGVMRMPVVDIKVNIHKNNTDNRWIAIVCWCGPGVWRVHVGDVLHCFNVFFRRMATRFREDYLIWVKWQEIQKSYISTLDSILQSWTSSHGDSCTPCKQRRRFTAWCNSGYIHIA